MLNIQRATRLFLIFILSLCFNKINAQYTSAVVIGDTIFVEACGSDVFIENFNLTDLANEVFSGQSVDWSYGSESDFDAFQDFLGKTEIDGISLGNTYPINGNTADVYQWGVELGNSVADFSDTQGQNNWEYWMYIWDNIPATAQQLVYNSSAFPAQWESSDPITNPSLRITSLLSHPSSGNVPNFEMAVRRWVSDFNGFINISGEYEDLIPNGTDGQKVRIYHIENTASASNEDQLYSTQNFGGTAPFGPDGQIPADPYPYSINIPVQVGDVIDFGNDRNLAVGEMFDLTSWTSIIKPAIIRASVGTDDYVLKLNIAGEAPTLSLASGASVPANLCEADNFDLASLDFSDENNVIYSGNTDGVWSEATTGQDLANNEIAVSDLTTDYVYTTDGDCPGSFTISIVGEPTPDILLPYNNVTLCEDQMNVDTIAFTIANALSGTAQWYEGNDNNGTPVDGIQTVGAGDEYYFEFTSDDDCVDGQALTIDNINATNDINFPTYNASYMGATIDDVGQINGGVPSSSTNTVDFYSDAAATMPISNGIDFFGFEFTPANFGTFYYVVNEEGCVSEINTITISQTAAAAPDPPTFNSPYNMCSNDIQSITATGISIGASVNWYEDMNGTIPVPTAQISGSDNETFTPVATDNGTYFVSQTDASGESDLVSFELNMFQPLEQPIGMCTDPTTNSIILDWQDVPDAVEYAVQYFIDDSPPIFDTIPQSELIFNGLDEGTQISAVITALAAPDNPCGNSEQSNQILPQNCETLECIQENVYSFVGLDSSYCFNNNAPINLMVSSGAPAGTFSGPGVTGTTFIPDDVGTQGEVTITYTYPDPDIAGCDQLVTTTVNLVSLLNPPVAFCDGATTDEITISWNNVPDNQGYEINYELNPGDGNPAVPVTINQDVTTFTLGSLSPGDVVSFGLATISACGGGTSGTPFDCSAQNCPTEANPFVVSNFTDGENICADIGDITLMAAGGTNGSFSGDGVTGNTFNPSTETGIVSIAYNYIDANDCPQTGTIQVLVNPALATPVVSCQDEQTTEITVAWDDVTGETGYELTYTDNNGPTTVPLGANVNSFTLDNLTENQNILFEVVALGDAPCGNSAAGGAACTTTSCPDNSTAFAVNNVPATICEDASTITLMTDDASQLGTFGGNGVLGNFFSPANLGGTTSTITYSYTDENDCELVGSFEVDIIESLETPDVFCLSSTTNSITINWDGQVLADDYTITYENNGSQSITQTDTFYTINGLIPGTEIEFFVMANGSNLCGNSEVSSGQECTAEDCTTDANPFVPSNLPTEICITDNTITLESNQPTPNGTFSGDGVSGGDFNPTDAGAGTASISYSYEDDEGCPQTGSTTVEVVAPLNPPILGCVMTDFNSITVSWDGDLNAPNYDVTYNVIGETDMTTETTSDTFLVVSSLEPDTEYEWTVFPNISNICGMSMQSNTVICMTSACTAEPNPFVPTNLPDTICINENPIQILPTQGVQDAFYSGDGLTGAGDTFDPSNAGVGTATVNYNYNDDNGCPQVGTVMVEVVAPLNAPVITCGDATTSSVSIDWTAIDGADGYEISYSINSAATQTANTATTSFVLDTGISPNDEVSFQIIALGSGICGNSEVSNTVLCTAADCVAALNPFTIDGAPDSICIDNGFFALVTDDPLVEGVFGGPGVALGDFDPASAGLGTHTLTYTYDDSDGCEQVGSADITVVAPLAAPIISCGPNSLTSISIEWDAVANANEYLITFVPLGGDAIEIDNTADLFYELTDLTFGGNYTFQISAVGVNACGESEFSNPIDCSTLACNPVSNPFTIIGLPDSICIDTPAELLNTDDPNLSGVYGGPGVTVDEFEPAAAGLGVHTLTYTYDDEDGCEQVGSIDITIVEPLDIPVVSCGDFTQTSIIMDWDDITGAESYNVEYILNTDFPVTINTTNSEYEFEDLAPSDQIQATVVAVAPMGYPCGNSDPSDQVFPQDCQTLPCEIDPNPFTITNVPDTLCINEMAFILTTDDPAESGMYVGNGITVNVFDPIDAGVGLQELIYAYQDTAGCDQADTIEVTIVDFETATIVADTSFCVGETIDLSLSITNFDNVSWSGPNAFISDEANPQILDAQTENGGEYIATIDHGNTCTQMVMTNIVINTLPTIDLASNSPICLGETLELEETGGEAVSWDWSGPNAFESDVFNPFIANATAVDAGVYTVVIEDANGCQREDQITVVINGDQAPEIQAAGPFCSNENVQQLFADIPGGNWLGDVSVTGEFDPTIGAGMYEVIYQTTGNCPATDTLEIEVVDLPLVEAGMGGIITCSDTSVNLIGSTNADVTLATVVWTGPQILSGANSLQAEVGSAGMYFLTITEGGCAATDSVEVTQEATVPNAVVVGDDVYDCQNEGQLLPIDGSGSSQGPNITYLWTVDPVSIPTGVIPPIEENAQIINVAVAGTYILTVTNTDNNCSATDNAVIGENILQPDISVTPTAEIACAGNTVFLSGSSTTPNAVYEWMTTDGVIVAGANTPTPEVSSEGTYSLVITGENFCTDTADVVVSESSPIMITFGTPDLITCTDSEIMLEGSVPLAAGTDPIFQWTTNDGAISSGANSDNAFVTSAGTYVLTVSNLNGGCITTDSLMVQQDTSVVTAVVGADQDICSSGQAMLTASGGDTYVWNPGNLMGDNITVSPTDTTTYTVTVSNSANGCSDMAQVTVNVLPQLNAGLGGDVGTVCNDVIEGTTTTTLFETTTDTGTWAALDGGPAIDVNGMIDANGFTTLAEFNYGYIVSSACGNDTALFSLTIEDCQTDCQNPAVATAMTDFTVCGETQVNIDGNIGGSASSASWSLFSGDGIIGDPFSLNTAYTFGTNDLINEQVVLVLTTDDPDAGGVCEPATDTLTISLGVAPIADLGDDLTICSSQFVTLTASGGDSYVWQPGNVSGTVIQVSATVTADYIVTATDNATGCTDNDTITVFVNQPINAGLDATASLCNDAAEGDVTQDLDDLLTTTNTTGTWFFVSGTDVLDVDNVYDGTGQADNTVSVYEYVLEGAPPCVNDTALVTITTIDCASCPDPPIANFQYGLNGQFCTQQMNNELVTFIGGGTAGTFTATPLGLSINPANGVIDVGASVEGTYTVTNTIAASGGCPEVQSNFTVSIDVAVAAPEVMCQVVGNDVVFTWDAIPGAETYTLFYQINDGEEISETTPLNTLSYTLTPGDTIFYSAASNNTFDNCFETLSDEDSCFIPGCPVVTVEIMEVDTLCGNDLTPFQLMASILLDGNPSIDAGTWSGDGIVNTATGLFDPAVSTTNPTIVYNTYDEGGGCVGIDSIEIFIGEIATIDWTLTSDTAICDGVDVDISFTLTGESPFDVTYFDGVNNFTESINDGEVLTLNPSTDVTYELLSAVDANGCAVAVNASNISVAVTDEGPTIVSFETTCTPDLTEYVVTVEITGGDSTTWEVLPAGQGVLTGNTFVSNLISSDDPYAFTFTDGNNCNPVDVSGLPNCDCISSAGIMPADLVNICETGATNLLVNSPVLDADDVAYYVLHTSPTTDLGDILAINLTDGIFTFGDTDNIPDSIFYVSYIVGTADINGNVDMADTCLSVAAGTPVVFNQFPTPDAGPNDTICGLTYDLNGVLSIFDGIYSAIETGVVFSDVNDINTSVTVANTGTYNFIWTEDNDGCQTSDTVLITFDGNPTIAVSDEIYCGTLSLTIDSLTVMAQNTSINGTFDLYNDLGGVPDIAGGTITEITIEGTYWLVYEEGSCMAQTSFMVTEQCNSDCPTTVMNAVSDTLDFCEMAMQDLTIYEAGVMTDLPANTQFTWVDEIGNEIIDPSNFAANHPGGLNCAVETIVLSYNAVCTDDTTIILSAGQVLINIYPIATLDMITLPTGCSGVVTDLCTTGSLDIEYSLNGIDFDSAPPTDLNAGDPDIDIVFQFSITGTPADCLNIPLSVYTISCPDDCPTTVDVLLGGEQFVCSGTIEDLTVWEAAVSTDNPLEAVFTWLNEDGTEVLDPSAVLLENNAGTCEADTLVFDLEISCVTDPSFTIEGGTITYVVFPDEIDNAWYALPTNDCQTTISNECGGNLTIEYSTDGGGTFFNIPPTIAPNDPDLDITYTIFMTEDPLSCAEDEGDFTVSCPDDCPTTVLNSKDWEEFVCNGEDFLLDFDDGNFTDLINAEVVNIIAPDGTSLPLGSNYEFNHSGDPCVIDTMVFDFEIDCITDTTLDLEGGTWTFYIFPEIVVDQIIEPINCNTSIEFACLEDHLQVEYSYDGGTNYTSTPISNIISGDTVVYQYIVSNSNPLFSGCGGLVSLVDTIFCPSDCPTTVITPVNETVSTCAGMQVLLADYQTAVTDNPILTDFVWRDQFGVDIPASSNLNITHSGTTCAPEQFIYNLVAVCVTDPSIEFPNAGLLTINVYPDVTASLVQQSDNCVTTLTDNCNGGFIVYEYSINGQPYSTTPPPNLNEGDASLVVDYLATIAGAPEGCNVFESQYTVSCPVVDCAEFFVEAITDSLCASAGQVVLIVNPPETLGEWSIVDAPPGSNPAVIESNEFETDNSDPGIYLVRFTATTDLGPDCPEFVETFINVAPIPNAGSADNITLCPGDVQEVSLPSLLSGNPEEGTWSASENVPLAAYDSVALTFNTIGLPPAVFEFVYTVPGTGDCNNRFTSAFVFIEADPTFDVETSTSLCGITADSLIYDLDNLIIEDGGVGLIWENLDLIGIDSSNVVDFNGLPTGNYNFVGTPNSACTDEVFPVQIFIEDNCSNRLEIPNAFSPNEDGLNDEFGPIYRNVAEADFKIFDRWGRLLFQTNDLSQRWDGFDEFEPVEIGVFIYWLQGTFIDGTPFEKTGDVTVVR